MYKYLLECLLSVLLGIYPEVELLDHMVILLLFSEEWPCCFLQQLYHITFAPAMHKGSNFSISLPALIFWFRDDGHSDGCEVVAYCGRICF